MTPDQTPDPSPEIRAKILALVDERHGCYWSDFYKALVPAYPEADVRVALRSLVRDSTLRMKDDDQEHDWEYRRNSKYTTQGD